MTGHVPLEEKVVRITRAFSRGHVSHAFGGALALAYYAEPRLTIDIDINVFVSPRRSVAVLNRLEELGVAIPANAKAAVLRDGQDRLRWGETPVDLFFSTHHFHEVCARRARSVPFGPDTIPILSAGDLVVFKALFNRRKDWIDIEQVIFAAPDLDVDYVRHWLRRFLADDDARLAKFERAAGTVLGP